MNNLNDENEQNELVDYDCQNSKEISSSSNSLLNYQPQQEQITGQLKHSVQTKVLQSKLICYISSFHLNINDWFNEYENIEIFKINLSKDLGKYINLFLNISADVIAI